MKSINWKYIVIGIGAVVIAGGVFVYSTIVSENKVSVEKEEILNDAEGRFERDKVNLTKSQRVLGEDATSGYYYTIYRDGDSIRAVREAWNGGSGNSPFVKYYFFENEELVLLKGLNAERENVEEIIEGSDKNTSTLYQFFFEGSKMIRWLQDGIEVTSEEDSHWEQVEESALTQAQFILKYLK